MADCPHHNRFEESHKEHYKKTGEHDVKIGRLDMWIKLNSGIHIAGYIGVIYTLMRMAGG